MPEEQRDRQGTVFTDKQRFVDWREIGEGGTALVYEAQDKWLGRRVAIKMIKEEYANVRVYLDTLKAEVGISRSLGSHPYIASVHEFYDSSNYQDGPPGFGVVMDFIEGVELKKWMRRTQNRMLDTAQARFDVLLKLFDALQHAHRLVTHRDLKPQNIMLVDGDIERPIIMDFGFAVPHAVGPGAFRIGTLGYMSPEQYAAPDEVDQRADIFAMGILCYELFTGKHPLTSLRYMDEDKGVPEPVPLSDIRLPSSFCAAVPPGLDQLILQMMSFEATDRPFDATTVLQSLKSMSMLDASDSRSDDDRAARAISIPSGDVVLGAGADSELALPERLVELSAFRIDRYPVTNKEFFAFVETTGHRQSTSLPGDARKRPNHPVNVSWEDACAYAHWVGGFLPSEAQWEYCAKGEAFDAPYPWGEEPPTPVLANIGHGEGSPVPVGSYPAGKSPFGVHDLCGNVWEWCADHWSADYYVNLSSGCSDPVNSDGGDERSLRGGAYDSFPSSGRCGFRFFAKKDEQAPWIGFRVAYHAADDVPSSGEGAS